VSNRDRRVAKAASTLYRKGTNAMMSALAYLMLRLKNDRRGVTVLEYGLIASMIALVIVTSVASLGNQLAPVFTTLAAKL
jgi:pilus assembly protein Flp/PilA